MCKVATLKLKPTLVTMKSAEQGLALQFPGIHACPRHRARLEAAVLLTVILGALAGLSLALTLWQWLGALRFPLHRRIAPPPGTPDICVLKPLKGADAETAHCLRSWLEQDYTGPIQILFGVASPEDPVCEVVRQLLREHPKAHAQLVVCPENLGANPKVSTLIQLERVVRQEVVIVSDADVLVPRDFLTQIAWPLREPGVGLVNCFYQLRGARNLA